MFPSIEDLQARRKEVISRLDELIAKRQQYKEDLASGKITAEEHKKYLDELHQTMRCPIRNNFNERYGSMGTGLDGMGNPTGNSALTKDCRTQQDGDRYSTLTLQEIYLLRSHAGKVGNTEMLTHIKMHLNARVGTKDTPYPFYQSTAELSEVLAMNPPEVWIVVDHAITDTQGAERASHLLACEIHELSGGTIKVSMHSGEYPEIKHREQHVILLAMANGFCVLKARGTETAGSIIRRPAV